MDPRIIVDDAANLSPDYMGRYGSWSTVRDSAVLYNGTRIVCHPEHRTREPPNFWFNFYGSDLTFYGPPMASDVVGTYTVNHVGGTLRKDLPLNKAIPASSTLRSGVELFTIDDLSEGDFHTVKVFPANGQFSFDYMTYKPSYLTNLVGKNIIVDDADPAVEYSFGWGPVKNENLASGVPYRDTLTGTRLKGASLSFPFNGTSVAVYGALNSQAGTLDVEFWVDDGFKTPYNFFNGSQRVNPTSWAVNQRLYQQDRMKSGEHTLFVHLKNVTQDQMLWIDSVIYQGSEATDLSSTFTQSPITVLPPSTVGAPTSASSSRHPWIAGIILPLVLVAALLGAAWRFRWLNRFRRRRASRYMQSSSPTGDFKAPPYTHSRTNSLAPLVDYKDASLFTSPPPTALTFKDAGYDHGAPLYPPSPTHGRTLSGTAEWKPAPPTHTRTKSQTSVDWTGKLPPSDV